MNDQFTGYLSALNVTRIVEDRVREVYTFYQEICPEEITDVFITEYITEDGLREYENLWFFSKTCVMEAKNFLSMDQFDLVPFHAVVRWEVKGEHYDYKSATSKSRLHLSISFATLGVSFNGIFRASQENCDYLMTLLRERFTLPAP